MRRVAVEDGHKCPLCPDHWDEPDSFVWSELLKAAVCHGCTYDIHNGFLGFAECPTPDNYSAGGRMQRITELTGLTYQQAKFFYLRSWLHDDKGKISKKLKVFNPLRAADADLHAVNIKLDARVTRICSRAVDVTISWHDDPAIFSALARVMRDHGAINSGLPRIVGRRR